MRRVSNKFPAGLYDVLLTDDAERRIDREASRSRELTPAEGDRLIEVLHRKLKDVLNDLADGQSLRPQINLINDLLCELRKRLPRDAADAVELLPDSPRILTSILQRGLHPEGPETGLLAPWLFTAGKGTPSLLSEIRRELCSAEQVDILVSFITVSGVRKLRDVLQQATATGADAKPPTRIRVLTTTYIGATEIAAVDELARLPGCEVRISLDGRRTRLHAKAWMFHRNTGFGSAYVGSANLTGAALAGGLEWTVKFTERSQVDLYSRAVAHFATLWEDDEFQPYNPDDSNHRRALQQALGRESGDHGAPHLVSFFDLQPKTYQQDMLEQLSIERLHGRTRNLVVAATGTGKTVVAAFDFRRTSEVLGHRPRLLFVAHRREILRQALRTYREVLKDNEFGQLLTGSEQPISFDYLFATIDTLTSRGLIDKLGADYWHTIVIDECHRIAGDRFHALATSVRPSILLGLTATPERTDSQPISPYFDSRPDGSPAVELRLWDALDLQLLSPFEYYACDDDTDFSAVPWNRVGEQQAISSLISNNDLRARTILREWKRLTTDPRKGRAIVFCVSVDHAHFVADYFRRDGLPVAVVTGATSFEDRDKARSDLASGSLCALITVDLFNEGIDLPMVDTLLMLRPTQSSLLFQQQLGRGLRLHPGKESCLVLDFVGHHNADFRYDRLISTITGLSRRELIENIEHGFSSLPAGCHIQLQKQVRDRVLQSLRQQINQQWRNLRAELQALTSVRAAQPSLGTFLHEQALELKDIYRASGARGWTTLKRDAGLIISEPGPEEAYLSAHLSSLRHRNSLNQIEALRMAADLSQVPTRDLSSDEHKLLQMLAYQVDGSLDRLGGPESFIDRIRANPAIAQELRELADVLETNSVLPAIPLPGLESSLLHLHGNYERREILTAVDFHNEKSRPFHNTGVFRLPNLKTELLFVTLDKSSGFHKGISYHDYAISPTRFHWQTQNNAGPLTSIGQRYLESETNGWSFQLFVRTTPDKPYVACGPVRIMDTHGEKPMNIVWRLEHSLTARLFQQFSVLRGL